MVPRHHAQLRRTPGGGQPPGTVLIADGAGPETIIAVALPRSAQAVIAILAALTTGAAYVPVDPDYPAQRIEHILTDAEPVLILTDTTTAATLPAHQAPAVLLDHPALTARLADTSTADITDSDRTTPLLPAHPAFVIYTSGSTGRPKGVAMEHRSVVNLFEDHRIRLSNRPSPPPARTGSASASPPHSPSTPPGPNCSGCSTATNST